MNAFPKLNVQIVCTVRAKVDSGTVFWNSYAANRWRWWPSPIIWEK